MKINHQHPQRKQKTLQIQLTRFYNPSKPSLNCGSPFITAKTTVTQKSATFEIEPRGGSSKEMTKPPISLETLRKKVHMQIPLQSKETSGTIEQLHNSRVNPLKNHQEPTTLKKCINNTTKSPLDTQKPDAYLTTNGYTATTSAISSDMKYGHFAVSLMK